MKRSEKNTEIEKKLLGQPNILLVPKPYNLVSINFHLSLSEKMVKSYLNPQVKHATPPPSKACHSTPK